MWQQVGHKLKRSENNSTKTSTILSKKTLHVSSQRNHEYAEADSTTTSLSAVPAIEIRPVSVYSFKTSDPICIYTNNVRQEYERMLRSISLSDSSSSNLQNDIPYEFFLNAILQMDQYCILLFGKVTHYQLLIHHLKNCLQCNNIVGACLCLTYQIHKDKMLFKSNSHIHEPLEADSTTISCSTVPLVEIALVKSDPLKYPQLDSIFLNNIRHLYEQMLISISLFKPQLLNVQKYVPFVNFLNAVLQTYHYYVQAFGKIFHFKHLINHIKNCLRCNTIIGSCLCSTSP